MIKEKINILNASEEEIAEVISLMKQMTLEGKREVRRMAILQNAIQKYSGKGTPLDNGTKVS